MKRIAPLSVIGCLGLLFAASTCFAQAYKITDLGPLSPAGINTWGQVVGDYNNQAYLWTKRYGMRPLGTLGGGTFSSAAAINDLGMIVGTADGPGKIIFFDSSVTQDCDDLTQPFVWTSTKGMQGLTVLSPVGPDWDGALCLSLATHATDINDLGQVVGYNSPFDTFQFGLLWAPKNGITRLGGSYPPTMAISISNTSQIVGQSESLSLYIGKAAFWKNGVETDLADLGTGAGADSLYYGSAANGVNDLGQVVGWSTIGPVWALGVGLESPVHALLWTASGALRDLGTLPGDTSSAASKINLFGQVIGSSGNTNYSSDVDHSSPFKVVGRAFVWSELTGMLDLNTLIPGNSGWMLNSATDINIWGQIVGDGTLNGQPHGFLLTPRTLLGF